jgi:Zn-dependent protease with chaperone function
LIFTVLTIGGNFEKAEILAVIAVSGILFFIFFLQTILFLLIWLMTTRTFQTPLQMDEYSSDTYAAKALRNCFAVEKPSLCLKEVLEDIMKEIEKIRGKKPSFYQKMQYVFKGGTHPSIEDRIENIEKYIDRKSS